MASLTYAVQIDWNDNGCFTDANEDVTANVISVDWRRGRGQPHHLAGRSRAGVARIVLNNDSGIYSPLNTSSALTGNLKPGRWVRIRTSGGAGSEDTRWQGFIQSITPRVQAGNLNTVTLQCVGSLGYIGSREVEIAMQTNITVDAAIGLILDEIGWPKDELYDDEVNADSPVGYWRLGESSGDAQDETVNNNDGTVSGVVQGQTGLLGSSTNGAYLWDDNSDRIDLGSPAVLDDIFAGGGTFECIVNVNSAGDNAATTSHLFNKFHTIAFLTNPSGNFMKFGIEKQFSGVDGDWDTQERVIEVGKTYHIVVVYNADSASNDPTFYINGCEYSVANGGIDERNTPTGSPTSDAARTLYLGNNDSSIRGIDGKLDEIAFYSSQLSAARIEAHYKAVRTWRDLDTAKTTMNRWWVDRTTVTRALRSLEQTENGFIYETKDGSIAFRHGHDRFANKTSKATFSDAAGAARAYQSVSQRDPARGIYNLLETEVQIYSVGSTATLWTYADTIKPYIEPGVSRDFWARYPVNDSPTQDVGADTWITPVENTDYDANEFADGSGEDLSSTLTIATEKFGESMKITVTNGHATKGAFMVDTGGNIKIQARGTPVSASDPIQVRQESTASQDTHGERTYEARDTWMPSYDDADAWARVNRDLYKDPSPTISITVLGNRSSTILDELEDRDINERITVGADSDAGLGFNQDWFIEAERHTVRNKFDHRVTWDLSDVTAYDLYWQLAGSTTETISVLGTNTKLGR